MADVEFTDNSDEIKKLMKIAVKRGLKTIGREAEKNAKKAEGLVDTGRLRNSITFALSGEAADKGMYQDNNGKQYAYSGAAPQDNGNEQAVYVGSNVEYAPYVEYGTHTVPAQHFLQDAAQNHTAEYKNIMEQSIQSVEA